MCHFLNALRRYTGLRHTKMKMMNLQYFWIFLYIWWLLKFLRVFFCGKLTKPCHHARTFQLVSQQSLRHARTFQLVSQQSLRLARTFQLVSQQSLRLARTFQLVSQQSLAGINNKISKILTKRPPVAITVLSGTQRHHWGIGIPGYTFVSLILAQAIPSPSWSSAPPVTTGSL